MQWLKTTALAAVLAGALCGQSFAHTPYMKPSIFDPSGNWTSIQTAYGTELFSPILGINGPDMHIVAPDGGSSRFTTVHVTPGETTLEMALPAQGTYRLTTGEIVGAPDSMIYQHGHWRALGAGETAPRHAQVTTMRMVTVAEAYITKGEPTRAALEPVVGTLAIHPITHPDEATVASGLELELLFNGQPFPNMPFVLYARGQSEDDESHSFVTDANGRATLRFTAPGTYLAVVRYRVRDAASNEVRSYSTSLTFDVKPAS
ncbi:MAG TPA: DUF4198 domain-containing protein [Caulobacterales bacterium]|nr:DUF4198 domain-containing protein [Caulobacterales bacterium]